MSAPGPAFCRPGCYSPAPVCCAAEALSEEGDFEEGALAAADPSEEKPPSGVGVLSGGFFSEGGASSEEAVSSEGTGVVGEISLPVISVGASRLESCQKHPILLIPAQREKRSKDVRA